MCCVTSASMVPMNISRNLSRIGCDLSCHKDVTEAARSFSNAAVSRVLLGATYDDVRNGVCGASGEGQAIHPRQCA